jgi:hypothetical protein
MNGRGEDFDAALRSGCLFLSLVLALVFLAGAGAAVLLVSAAG